MEATETIIAACADNLQNLATHVLQLVQAYLAKNKLQTGGMVFLDMDQLTFQEISIVVEFLDRAGPMKFYPELDVKKGRWTLSFNLNQGASARVIDEVLARIRPVTE